MDVKKKINDGHTFKITIDASQVKKELNEVEAQLDRIIEKQDKIGKNHKYGWNNTGNGIGTRNTCTSSGEKLKNIKPPSTGSGIK